MDQLGYYPGSLLVAPHVGAWIEIINNVHTMDFSVVAPHVGAWIEMDSSRLVLTKLLLSHLT